MSLRSMYTAYQRNVRDEIDELYEKQRELGHKNVEQMERALHRTHAARLDESTVKLREAENKLEILMAAGPDEWENHRDELERMIRDLRELLHAPESE